MVLDPWSVYRLASSEVANSQRSGVPGVTDHLADEPAGETPGRAHAERVESMSAMLSRRRAELQKKIDEILGATETTPVPKAPPGMRRNKCHGTPKSVASILRPCYGCAEASAQTEVSLLHVHRDILWTAACP